MTTVCQRILHSKTDPLQLRFDYPTIGEEGTTPNIDKIAMFCTGGIRCEKATSFATHIFPNTDLKGGI
jgi:predicted sulfurtransferase